MTKAEIMAMGIARKTPAPMPKHPLQDPGSRVRPHNRKLGWLISTFSIPAKVTCPGRTPACSKGCYALRFLFLLQWARLVYLWEWTRRKSFVADVIAQIRHDHIEIVRPHVSGDMYSAGYALKWLDVFARAPRCRFFFYTRSWRKADGSINRAMVRVFTAMAVLPNVGVWFSEDRESGPAPKVPGIRVAWTCFDPADEALVPSYADLVFRDSAKRGAYRAKPFAPRKWVNGVWVCPVEQDPTRKTTVSCSTCKYCVLRDRPMPMPK